MHRRITASIEPSENEPDDADIPKTIGHDHEIQYERRLMERERLEKQRLDRQRLSVWERIWTRLSVLKYIFLILIIPPILNYAALKRERNALLPAQGEQVDMGWGQKMFIKCLGEGLPTVILDASTGGTSEDWYLIETKLAKLTRVCVYDRAGLGFSELPFVNDITHSQKQKSENRKFVSQVATLEQMTCDLHHLVTVAKPLTRPFILVGSEIGALIARHYALTYPEDVHDIVLLNPFVEDLFWRQKEDWNSFWNFQLVPSLESLQLAAYIGMARLAVLTGRIKADLSGDTVPKEVELIQLSRMCNGNHIGAVLHEYLLLNTSFSQMIEVWKAKSFPKNVSVTVINSRNYDKFPSKLQKAWQQSQLYLRQSLHPTCKHYTAEGTGQQLFTDPRPVVNLVQQLIIRWRVTYNVLPTVHTFREQEAYAA